MIFNRDSLVKKYATAFVNLFAQELTVQDCFLLSQAAASLKRNKRLLFFFNLHSINPVVKALSIEQIAKKYNLNSTIKKLMHLLLEQNRLSLIPFVLETIASLYKQNKKIQDCIIYSSSHLSDGELETIKRFIEQKAHCSIIYTQVVDPTLIAGIRVQSNTLLWEHSVSKDLRLIESTLIR